MSEEAAKYETKKEVKTPKKRAKTFKGLVKMNFTIEGKTFKRGDKYSTKDEHTFNKLIKLTKINKI